MSRWDQPPFWAAKHSEAELDRRRCRELQRLRVRLSYADVDEPLWREIYDRIRVLERELKLTPTLNGVGMPRG